MRGMARLVRINDEQPEDGRWLDLMAVYVDGRKVDEVWCDSDEDDAPYIEALEKAGWTVIGEHRGDWFVEKAEPERFEKAGTIKDGVVKEWGL
jgi:hypothetical protein